MEFIILEFIICQKNKEGLIIEIEQAINQLKDLREHCVSMGDGPESELYKDDIWYQDTVALDIAIKELKKKAPRDCNPIRAIRKILNSIISYRRK